MVSANPNSPIAVVVVDSSGTVVTPLVAANNLSDVASVPLSRLTLLNYATTATAAGTTTLTVASAYQQYFTGTTTQTVTLPVASTMTVGMGFRIVNLSTGLVTVNSSGSNAVFLIPGGTTAQITCILTAGTTAASWDAKGAQLEAIGPAACSDETTAITATTNKVKFRLPYAFTFLPGAQGVKGSLSTAQASGATFTVDVNITGVGTILSTKLTIDNTATTSIGASVPPVFSTTSGAADAEVTVDVDAIGDGTAKGLKITLIGYRSG